MNCDQARLRLASYLDGESPQDEREKVENHLRGCVACREELEALRRTMNLAGSWKVEAAADLWDAISDAMDDEPEAQTAADENQMAGIMTLLLEMQREIRDLRSEVADLRSELSGRIGSLSMRTRMPADNAPRFPLGTASQSQRISGADISWGISKEQDAAKLEYTRLTSSDHPLMRKWPIKVEEDDLWN